MVIMKVVYGISVESTDDLYVKIADEAMEGPVEGLVPGRFLVEFLPFLRHIPTWFPFATSQRLWAKWQASGERLKNTPFEETRAKMVCATYHPFEYDFTFTLQDSGNARHSVVAKSLRRLEKLGVSSADEIEIIKNVGAVVYEGTR